jgi:transcription elongation factor GreB
MSKAFTREGDDSGDEEIIASWPPLPLGARNYITPEGARRMKERLQHLQEKKESAEATGAESKKLESAIRNLKQRLDSLVIVEPPADAAKIAVGAIVNVRHRNGEEETYRIVGVDESDPEKGSISWISPLAKALLSRGAGEKVRFRIPAGEDELEILSVRY